MLFFVFLFVVLGFSLVFLCFSLDSHKGRIFLNTLQISPKSAKILPLQIFFKLTTESLGLLGSHGGSKRGYTENDTKREAANVARPPAATKQLRFSLVFFT